MEDEIDLREYVMVLLRHWKMIGALAIMAAVVAGGVSLLLPPTYEATALVSVAQPRYTLRLEGVPQGPPIPVKAYPDLALSDGVLSRVFSEVRDGLPSRVDTLSEFRRILKASPAPDPSVLRLTVRDTDPGRAAKIANAWANVFTAGAGRLYGQDAANLANYEEQLATARTNLDTAEQALAAFQASNQVAILQAQLESKQAILTNYLNRRHQLDLLIQDAQDLLTRLETLDPGAPSGLTDDLMVLSLSVRMFGNQTISGEFQMDQPAVPLQVQIVSGQSLSGKTTAEQVALLKDLLDTLQARVVDAQVRVEALEPEILELQGRLGEAQTRENQLARALDLAETQYKTMANIVQEARVATQDSANIVQIASEATVPTERAGPRRTLNTALGGALGILVGVFAAFVGEWWRAPRSVVAQGALASALAASGANPDGGRSRLTGREDLVEAPEFETATGKPLQRQ